VVSYLEWKAADEKMDSEGSAADNDDHTIGVRVIVEELDVFCEYQFTLLVISVCHLIPLICRSDNEHILHATK